MIIGIHSGAFIMVGIRAKEKFIKSRGWVGKMEAGILHVSSEGGPFEIA